MTVLSRNLWRSFAAATLALALELSLPQSAQAGLDVLLRGFCCDVFCGNPDEAHWSDWPLSGTCFSDQLESNSLVHCCEKLENECTGFLISEEFSRTAQTRFYGCIKSQKTGTIRDVNPGKSLTDPRYQGPAEAL
jgi:hypothetical protein